MCLPLAAVGIAASVASAAVGAYGAYQSGQAQSQAAAYQAQVAQNNATVANQNATAARQSGAIQEQISRMKSADLEGKQRAAAASNGFDVNSGSNLDLQAGTAAMGNQDALTIRNQTARTAYGYQVQAQNFSSTSALDTMQSSNASTAGYLSASGSIAGGAASVGDKYLTYQQKGLIS